MDRSSLQPTPSEVIRPNKEELVTITERVNLTKSQHEVLNIICNTYGESVSEYMQEALVEAMKFDIEEGNLSDVLLEKISDRKEGEKVNKEKDSNSSFKGSSIDNELGADLQF
jgi:hypothetical protein